jgi:hypothetical protein
LVLGVSGMETSKDFTTLVKKFSQTLIFERSFRDVSNVKNHRCPRADYQREENSCAQVIFILAGNDYEEEVRFWSSNDNAIPLLFNMKGKTYEKAIRLPLTSHLTILYWCTTDVNLVVQEAPLKKNANLLLTYLNSAWDDRLEEVNLEVRTTEDQSGNNSEHTSKNCSFNTSKILRVRKDRQPLTLVQSCYTKLLVHVLENCEGKQLIDIRKIMQKASIEMSVIHPDYYEIVSVLNPMIVKNAKDYDFPVREHIPFKNKLKILFKALRQ